MNILNFGTQNLFIERFIEENSDGQIAWDRWAEFSHGLLNSDAIIPLWSDRNFRWGYQLVLNTVTALDYYNPCNLRKCANPPSKAEAVKMILIDFSDGDSEEACLMIIKGLELLLEEEGAPDDYVKRNANALETDLKLLLVVAQESNKADDIVRSAIVSIEKLISQEKRKPLMAAA